MTPRWLDVDALTDDDLIALGEAAVRGHLDFQRARAALVTIAAEHAAARPAPEMTALEAALRGLACKCRGDTEGHEASEHLTAGEQEVFEQVRAARPAPSAAPSGLTVERLAALLKEMYNLPDDMSTRDEAAWLLSKLAP